MSININEGGLPFKLQDLSLSARVVVSYLQFESMINGKQEVTFREIVEGTGLSQRAVRGALSELKAKGVIEVLLDITRGRRYVYKLLQKNISIVEENIESGLYLVDIGIGVPTMLSFRAYRAIRASAVAYYTDSVPKSFLEFTKCTCALIPLRTARPSQFASLASKIVANGGSLSIVYDQLLDWENINEYLTEVGKLPQVKVRFVPSVSPMAIATQFLISNIGESMVFKRDNMAIKIIPLSPGERPRINESLVVKIFEVKKLDNSIELRQLENLSELVSDYWRVAIVYEVSPTYQR